MDLRGQLFVTEDVILIAEEKAVEKYRRQEAYFAARDRLAARKRNPQPEPEAPQLTAVDRAIARNSR